ncbi:MAG: S8 family serine peptidase [Archaeoglobaceae archaeon]
MYNTSRAFIAMMLRVLVICSIILFLTYTSTAYVQGEGFSGKVNSSQMERSDQLTPDSLNYREESRSRPETPDHGVLTKSRDQKISSYLQKLITDSSQEEKEMNVKIILKKGSDDGGEVETIGDKCNITSRNDNLIFAQCKGKEIFAISELDGIELIMYDCKPVLTVDRAKRLMSDDVVTSGGFSCNTTVGIADTGIVPHSHFDNINIYYAWDWVDQDDVPFDASNDLPNYGHGTHVAGIVSGSSGNWTSASPDANLLIGRVFGGDVNDDDKADFKYKDDSGLRLWLRMMDPDQDGNTREPSSPQVLSNSWVMNSGFGTYDDWAFTIDEIVNGKYSYRPVFVFASGNQKSSNYVSPPATAKNIITVGACSDRELNPSTFSQRGTEDGRVKPDVLAPGESITSAVPYGQNDEGYEAWDGTSMAVPFVSSLAAQIKSNYPDATPELVKAMMISSAFKGGTTDDTSLDTGWGRISYYSTLYKLEDEIVDGYDFGYLGNTQSNYPYDVKYDVDISQDTDYLIVTMAYSDEAGPFGSGELKNDLDLYLSNPSGSTKLPDGHDTADDDSVNNVEKYIIKDPPSGKWTVGATINNLSPGEGPKFIPYAVSVRALDYDPEIKLVHHEGETSGIKVNNGSIYNCVVQSSNERVLLGDIPSNTMKNFTIDAGDLDLTYFDITGEEQTKQLSYTSADLNFSVDKDQLNYLNNSDKSFNFVSRSLSTEPEAGENTTVFLKTTGIHSGGVKEFIPEGFDVVEVYPVEVHAKLSKDKLVISWFDDDINWIAYTIKAENETSNAEFDGVFIDLSKSFDSRGVRGDTQFRNNSDLKATILESIIKYVSIEDRELRGVLKKDILKLINKYIENN